MRKRHRPPESWEAKIGTSSFDPLTVMDLQDAVRQRRKQVILNDRKFLLSYYQVNGEAKVYYSPAGPIFAPSGHLDIKRLLEE